MKNALTVGQNRTELGSMGDPVGITAIAAKFDIMDIVVVMGVSDISGWVVAEYDISGNNHSNPTYWANQEEALGDYLNRAFGVSF